MKKQSIETESENDSHTQEPQEEKPTIMESSESFMYKDGKGKELCLGSAIFSVAQLCDMANQFLNLPQSTSKSKEMPGVN